MVDHDAVAPRFSATASRYLALVQAPDLARRDRLEVLRALVPVIGDLLSLMVEFPEVSDEQLHLGRRNATGPFRAASSPVSESGTAIARCSIRTPPKTTKTGKATLSTDRSPTISRT